MKHPAQMVLTLTTECQGPGMSGEPGELHGGCPSGQASWCLSEAADLEDQAMRVEKSVFMTVGNFNPLCFIGDRMIAIAAEQSIGSGMLLLPGGRIRDWAWGVGCFWSAEEPDCLLPSHVN